MIKDIDYFGSVRPLNPIFFHLIHLQQHQIFHDPIHKCYSLILQQNGGAIKARINSSIYLGNNSPHCCWQAIEFVTSLVGLINSENELLVLQDVRGYNPLHVPAISWYATTPVCYVALTLAEKYDHLSRLKLADGNSALIKVTAFHSETPLHLLGKFPLRSLPCFVEIRRKQVVHGQALELLQTFIVIHEIIEAVVSTYPADTYSHDLRTRQYLFPVAVQNRSEKVFNLIYQTSDHKHQFSDLTDSSGDTLLHLAARLAPPHKLNLVSGASLLYRCSANYNGLSFKTKINFEMVFAYLQEVEKVVHPYSRERTNNAGKTPKMVFTEEHVKLKVDGEKWMKDTANSCTITASLIATVVFASAITVPGGTERGTGFPFFYNMISFSIFKKIFLMHCLMKLVCLVAIAACSSLPVTSFVLLQFRTQDNKPFY
ncbi:hypothetical protein ACJIZ3_002128 [Penstemon smallii]|uniref:PGG domain-containing protein n=1 Tax=Penstemon smallii TaxID=265156 RepID=A0ABD3U6Y7_9LAMI